MIRPTLFPRIFGGVLCQLFSIRRPISRVTSTLSKSRWTWCAPKAAPTYCRASITCARPGSLPRPCPTTSCRRWTTPASIPRHWLSTPTTRSTAVTSTTRPVYWCKPSISYAARSRTNPEPTASCAAAVPARSQLGLKQAGSLGMV